MIGRGGDVKPFELIRWAREQARVHGLRTLEAHVLLLLATYANRDAVAWPSIKTLAVDSGLRPTLDGRNSSVSAAIARLEELHLVWTVQGGNGHSARRELLFDPAAQPSARPEGCAAVQPPLVNPQPSARPEGCAPVSTGQPSGSQDVQPSGSQDQNYQGNGQQQLPRGTAKSSRPATRKAAHPAPRTADDGGDPEAVRAAIRHSLRAVA